MEFPYGSSPQVFTHIDLQATIRKCEVKMNLKVSEWHTVKVSRYITQLRASQNTVSFGNETSDENLKIFDS